jgi:hypothetical protein
LETTLPRQTTKPKTISHQTYLQALGLFTLAYQRVQVGQFAEKELLKLLGVEDLSHVSDELYGKGGDFDAALEREGIIVAPKRKR